MTKTIAILALLLGACVASNDDAPGADAGLTADASTFCPDVCDEAWTCTADGCECGGISCEATCDPVCDAWPDFTCDDGVCTCDTSEPLGPHIECTAA